MRMGMFHVFCEIFPSFLFMNLYDYIFTIPAFLGYNSIVLQNYEVIII